MNIICIILARKGSKRIPNKNLLYFNKKPLILWTLQQALRVRSFSKIILSSDSLKILDLAKKLSKKFSLNKRKSKFSGSKTKSETVIKYLSKIYKFKENDYLLLLQPTSPLRKDNDIKDTLKILFKYNLKTLHSGSYYKKKIKIKKQINLFTNKKKIYYKKKNFSYNGAIYFFNFGYFIKKNTLYEKRPNIYKMKSKFSLDVDDYQDIKNYNYRDYFSIK